MKKKSLALIYFTHSSKYFSLERFSSASMTMSNFHLIFKASFVLPLMASSSRLFQQSLRAASVCHFWQSVFTSSSSYLYLPLPAITICLFWPYQFVSFSSFCLPLPAASTCICPFIAETQYETVKNKNCTWICPKCEFFSFSDSFFGE